MNAVCRFCIALAVCGLGVSSLMAAGNLGTASTVTDDRPPTNARVALSLLVRDLNVEGESLSRVMDHFRNISGANLFVNWKALEAAGISKDTPVTLQVKGLRMRKMMELVLLQAAPNAQMIISVDQNVIEVTTQEDADSHLITRAYDVNEIVLPTGNDQVPPNLDISTASQSGSGSGGGGGQSLFGNTSSNQQSTDTKEKRSADLISVIESSVRPNIWKDNGGTSSMRIANGLLIVTAPLSVQETIAGVPRSEYVVKGGK